MCRSGSANPHVDLGRSRIETLPIGRIQLSNLHLQSAVSSSPRPARSRPGAGLPAAPMRARHGSRPRERDRRVRPPLARPEMPGSPGGAERPCSGEMPDCRAKARREFRCWPHCVRPVGDDLFGKNALSFLPPGTVFQARRRPT